MKSTHDQLPKYFEKVLKEKGEKFKSLPEGEISVHGERYQMAICCLMYAGTGTRREISSVVGIFQAMILVVVGPRQGVARILR